jgi:hypothetical protein
MDALTPVGPASRPSQADTPVLVPIRSPCFTHLNFRSLCLQPPTSLSTSLLHVTPQLVESPDCSGLGFTVAPLAHQTWQAESSSLSYGWIVRLLLLPTPPLDDAVAVGYRPENVCLEGTYTPLFSTTQHRALAGARSADVSSAYLPDFRSCARGAHSLPGYFRNRFRSEAVQTGMDTRRIWLFFRQRDGRILQAYLTVRRGIRRSATQ